MSKCNVTIVTAFFDIGRGDWSEEAGLPSYLQRTTDKYFKYFENLAKLDNPMVVYTSADNIEKVQSLRLGKETYIIKIDFNEKFKACREQVQTILDNEDFKSKVNPEQLKNPEYWSANYVLINNLKSYFLKKAILDLKLESEYFAWVDFGYCRDGAVLNNLKNWKINLDKEKVHLFTIKKKFHLNKENVYKSILNNEPYIIGGVIIATKNKWLEFSNLVYICQKSLLDELIIDDDQGVYLMCLLKDRELFQLNYLGKNKWFDVFKKFDVCSKLSFGDVLKQIVGRY